MKKIVNKRGLQRAKKGFTMKPIQKEKEFVRIIKKYTHHIKGGAYFELIDGFIPLELFISNLLEQERKIGLFEGLESKWGDDVIIKNLLKAQKEKLTIMSIKTILKINKKWIKRLKKISNLLKEQKEEFIKKQKTEQQVLDEIETYPIPPKGRRNSVWEQIKSWQKRLKENGR